MYLVGERREDEKRRARAEGGGGGEKEKGDFIKPAAGAARFCVLILQIDLDPRVVSHMAQN